MKKTILLFSFVALAGIAFAQKKTTSSAVIAFDATTDKDKLPKAENKTVIASIDIKTGDVAFEASVNNFSFANERMHQHFNSDQWFNSTTFPNFSYTGKITDLSKVNFNKDGSYNVSVSGDLTIKDITKPLTTSGIIVVKAGVLSATTDFSIKLADYAITGAPIEGGKVSREPKVTVAAEFK